MTTSGSPIAVLGSGSIGVSWAVVFARAGHNVRLFDVDTDRLDVAAQEVSAKFDDLHSAALLAEDVTASAARVTTTTDLGRALTGAGFVLECVSESLEVKRTLFTSLEPLLAPDAVVTSSSSAISASQSFAHCAFRDRSLVAHPANPPHILPVVELVPAPFTSEAAVESARAIFAEAGMSPVLVHRETEGFVYNRLQGAVLREAYCLVRDGVASPADIDRVMTEGLGRRWAVVGPFETVDLNTRGGIEVHAGRMGPAYERMGAERGQHDPWTPDLVATVTAARRAALPLDQWERRVRWRDRVLLTLERCRRSIPS